MCVLNIRGPETQFSQVSLKAIGVLLVKFFRREVHEKKHIGLRKEGGGGGAGWGLGQFADLRGDLVKKRGGVVLFREVDNPIHTMTAYMIHVNLCKVL